MQLGGFLEFPVYCTCISKGKCTSSSGPTINSYLAGLVEGGGIFPLLSEPLSASREHLKKKRSIKSNAKLRLKFNSLGVTV